MSKELLRFLASQPEPVGLGDISEWLEELFPEGHKRKRELMDVATQSHPISAPEPEFRDGDTESFSAPQPTHEASERDTVPPPSPARTRTLSWPLAATVLVAALAGAVVAVGIAGTDGGTTRDATATESAAAEPRPTVSTELSEAPAPAPEGPPAPVAPHPRVRTELSEAPVPRAQEPPVQEREPNEPVPVPRPTPEAPSVPVRPTPPTSAREAAPPERPRVPAAASTGTAVIVTPGGWAEVARNGRTAGQTPLRLVLPVGNHNLVLKPFGHGPAVQVTVRIRREEETRVVHRL
jgi:hypothetical protein